MKVENAVVKHLKLLNREKKYSSFYQLFHEIFGHLEDDEEFMHWMSSMLGTRLSRFRERMENWLERGFRDTRGRPKVSTEIAKIVCNTWIENSITSTDGSNMRNTINIKKRKAEEIYVDISILQHSEIKIEELTNKRKAIVLSSNRRISTCTVREIQAKLMSLNINISLGKIIALKPFFITHPTDKGMALCLCKLCLNIKLLKLLVFIILILIM